MSRMLAVSLAFAAVMALTPASVLGIPSQKDAQKSKATTQAKYEGLAKDLKFFPTGEFVYGRADKLRHAPLKWKETWDKVFSAL